MSGYVRVWVSNGAVVAAIDSDGRAVDDFSLTVDAIWDQLLDARENGQLHSALFNHRGIPVETNFGPWAVDGGVHHSVRRFTPAR
jgi:hypothetical protein